MTVLVKYNDTETVSMLREWKDELDGMLAMIRKDMSSEAALSKFNYLYSKTHY